MYVLNHNKPISITRDTVFAQFTEQKLPEDSWYGWNLVEF